MRKEFERLPAQLHLEFELGNTKDTYGRVLAFVIVDGESIQGTLLKEGYARVAYIMNPPYKYLETFRQDENLATFKEYFMIKSRYIV